MHKIIQTFIGVAVFEMGGTVLLGWLLHIPIMVQFKIGFVPMQFNAGLCFILTGLALALPGLTGKLFPRLQTTIGLALITLCSVIFIEILFDVSLGIDWPHLHTWIGDGNIRPNLIAPILHLVSSPSVLRLSKYPALQQKNKLCRHKY